MQAPIRSQLESRIPSSAPTPPGNSAFRPASRSLWNRNEGRGGIGTRDELFLLSSLQNCLQSKDIRQGTTSVVPQMAHSGSPALAAAGLQTNRRMAKAQHLFCDHSARPNSCPVTNTSPKTWRYEALIKEDGIVVLIRAMGATCVRHEGKTRTAETTGMVRRLNLLGGIREEQEASHGNSHNRH